MELISAKLHTSIGSFPSSPSLTGFLTSDEGISPIKTYPVYVIKSASKSDDLSEDKKEENDSINNTLIILNEEYEIMHKIETENEIKHISCFQTKIAISTLNDVRIIQKYGKELRTLCILDEENVCSSCFFLNGNGICITKKNKITLYNINDIINRYHAQLDAIEKQKEKLKKKKKIRKGLQSTATTPRSMATTPTSQDNNNNDHIFSFNQDDDDDSEIDTELMEIMDEINTLEPDINALVVRYRTIYIETQPPRDKKEEAKRGDIDDDDNKNNDNDNNDNDNNDNAEEWSISQVTMCCTNEFWWIGIIDNFDTLHVAKLLCGWPNMSDVKHIISAMNTTHIQLWRQQPSIAVSRTNNTSFNNDNNNNNNPNSWFIGMWTWFTNTSTVNISWYTLCGKTVLIVLDNNGIIHFWNEPSYNYILSSLMNDNDKFIFRCVLSLDSKKFIGFSCIHNILCDSPQFNQNREDEQQRDDLEFNINKQQQQEQVINDNDNDYIWLLTLDSMGTVTIYFIQNIVLYECGKASVIKFAQIDKGIIYRLQHTASSSTNSSLSFGYLFDTSRGITVTSPTHSNNIVPSPTMIEWFTYFKSGILAHFTIDINNKHVICNRMFGGVLPNDPIIKFTRHPSLRYNIFAALSRSRRLAIFDYSQNLDSANCNDGPKLIYVVPYQPVLAYAWDQQYRRLICISRRNNINDIKQSMHSIKNTAARPVIHSEFILSVHVYKSKHGWYDVWKTPTRLNNKEQIIEMIIAPYIGDKKHGISASSTHTFYHRQKKKKGHKLKQPKSNMIIVAQETGWNGFRIDLDKLARPYETSSTSINTKKDSQIKPGKEEKSQSKDDTNESLLTANLYHTDNNSKILIHRRPYGQIKAHRDRIRRRPPSQAPNSLYEWKKSDRRPAPLVVRSVKVDKELYGQQTSYTSEMLAAVIGEQYGMNKRLTACSGAVHGDRAVLICIFDETESKSEDKTEDNVSCACYTIYDNSKHDVSQIIIDNDKITQSNATLLRPECINSSRVVLIHEREGIMLYEKESSSKNEWKFEVLIPHKENKIELTSMMKTAGGTCIATAKQNLGSVRLLFPVLSDLATRWDQDTYFRRFPLNDLVMAQLENDDLPTIQKEWPEKAKISSFVFLSPTVLLLYRTDINQWIVARISTAAVAGWPGRPLYHPLALYEDMKCTNFKRIHRILRDFLMVLRRVPEEQYGSGDIRSRFLVPINWLLDKDQQTIYYKSHLQFDPSADYYLKPQEVNELHDLLQKIKLPMVSTQHNLTLLALTQTLRSVQEQQRNLDVPGAQFMYASNLFKLQRKTSVPLGCIAWAMHSDSQDALHDLCIPTTNVSYDTYKHLGVAYWIRNKPRLEKLVDKLAMTIYRRTKSPIDATLWYILLSKKRILVSLLKMCKGKEKLHKFMSRDFSEPRNQTAARTNAVSLTSKHKFFNACAFWILSGSYEPAINVALQNLDDPHLALLMARILWEDKDNEKFEDVLQNKILPAVSSKFHNNVWEQHMILWLLRKPQESVQVFLPSNDNSNACQMSDAPEIYAFCYYLQDNEIVKALREKQDVEEQQQQSSNAMNTSANASAAIFSSPLFDMFDMGDFDYATGTFKSADNTANDTQSEKKEDELKKPFEPKAYDLASKVIGDKDLTNLLRTAAVSYSRCGMLIHALESVEQVIKRMIAQRDKELDEGNQTYNKQQLLESQREFERKELSSLRQLESTLLWRFLCVRATVMETSHHIEPEQTKTDFADLSMRFPKFDALSTLNYLYGECHLRGFASHSCNIPSGPTLTRLLIVLSRAISHLTNVISHRYDRFNILDKINILQFMRKWKNVVDDLGLLGKERRIAIAAIAGIAHCGIFLKMFGMNRYDIIEDEICKTNLSPNLQSIAEWFNKDRLNNRDYLDDEYEDNIKLLRDRDESMNVENDKIDTLWTNEKLAHGPIELLVVKTFRFTILERFIFLWRKLLKKIGLHASHFIDIGTLYTQFSSWLLELSGDLQNTYQMAIIYCQENKVSNFDHITEPMTKYNMFANDDKTNRIYEKLSINTIMIHFVDKMKLFRMEHEEKKQEEKRDGYGYVITPTLSKQEERICYNNNNYWYSPYDIFKIDGDLPASVSYNTCNTEWISIATNNGLREINIDTSLRFRARNDDRTELMDAECDNYGDCLYRFQDIGSPKHTEIFGTSPFGGSGDKRHAKPYSISASSSSINENAKPFPINPLLPRIQLTRLPSFLHNKFDIRSPSSSSRSSKISSSLKQSPNLMPLTMNMNDNNNNNNNNDNKSDERGPLRLSLNRKPSEIYFSSWNVDDNDKKSALKTRGFNNNNNNNNNNNEPTIDRQYTIKPDADDTKTSIHSIPKVEFSKSQSLEKNIKRTEPQPAVTDTLFCNLFTGFSSYKLDIPLFNYCLHISSIGRKKRSLSNTYRFYSRVIQQQNKSFDVDNNYDNINKQQIKSATNHKELQISDRDLNARNEIYLIIAPHPSLPLYLSCSMSSDIKLWHYMHQYPLATFSLPTSSKSSHLSSSEAPSRTTTASRSQRNLKTSTNLTKTQSSGRISGIQTQSVSPQQLQKKVTSQQDYMTSLKFNSFGNKIAGISQNGNLYLWHFNVPRSIFRREFRAYYDQHCHDKFGNDLVFIRGSSCIATCGESTNASNVCVWDLLFCDRSRSLIRSYCCYEGNGANCLEYLDDIDSIIVGGHRGVLHMFDKRIPFAILKWEHGQSRIWKLSYLKNKKQILCATLEGNITIWDTRKLYLKSTLKKEDINLNLNNIDINIDQKPNIMKFNDLIIPENTATKSGTTSPLKKSASYGDRTGSGSDNDQNLNNIQQQQQTQQTAPTSLSYQSLNTAQTTFSSFKAINLDECIINEWKLFQRKTFLNHTFGSAAQLGYVASVGLTDTIWTPNGNILCTGSDGTVKYLKRKTKIFK